jgi:hypothetical protein
VLKPEHASVCYSEIASIQNEIHRRLDEHAISCAVRLRVVPPDYLTQLAPHIYGYELRLCGRVVWGDRGILALIPNWTARDIPLEDAWQLVCNRMIEQLAVADEIAKAGSISSYSSEYRTVKLCLDLATSFLLFCGEYLPTYQGRSARLMQLAGASSQMVGLPFPLRPFANLVQRLTRWKLCRDSTAMSQIFNVDKSLNLDTARYYTERLWRWELLALAKQTECPSNPALMRSWMQLQPLPKRLRGWASVARICGWNRSFRECRRWARLGMQCSPRYWIYAVGSDLFFRLPTLLELGDATIPKHCFQKWTECLPMRSTESLKQPTSWRKIAAEITWNYRLLLMGTSS